MSQKKSGIILGIFIVVLIGTALYFSIINKVYQPGTSQKSATTQTPGQIASWPTYSNLKYGFAFKYPNNWIYKTKTSAEAINENTYFSNDPKWQNCLGCAGTQLEVYVEKNTSIIDHLNAVSNFKIIKKDTLTINDNMFTHVIYSSTLPEEYLIEKDGDLINFNFSNPITIGSSSENGAEFISVSDFLTTFKINQINSPK